MKEWNKKNALWMVLYAVLYAVATAIVCVTGTITPILFVCYQTTAGILLSGVVISAYRKIKAPGFFTKLKNGICIFFKAILKYKNNKIDLVVKIYY